MKILVRGTNWIGDAVMTIPALNALRRIFPEAEIVLLTRRGAADVFEEADFIDEVCSFDAAGSSIGNVFRQAKMLRRKRFDLGILFTNSYESALTQWLARVPVRFGYSNEGRSLLLSDAIPIPEWKDERHQVFYYLNLIAAVEDTYFGTRAVMENPAEPTIPISEERRTRARKLLIESGPDLSSRTIALGIGSTNSRAKRWPAESYGLLANMIKDQLHANILLIGSAGDATVAEKVMGRSPSSMVDLTGRTTVAEAAALLSEIDLLISNDMGLAHVSAAVGTRTLVIFGPTNSVATRPFSEKADVIRKVVECSPCMFRDCPIDHRCMIRVTVEEVFAKAQQIIDVDAQEK